MPITPTTCIGIADGAMGFTALTVTALVECGDLTLDTTLGDGVRTRQGVHGTRSRDGMLHRGHVGAAHLALTTGAPIVPVGIVGTDRVLPTGSWPRSPGSATRTTSTATRRCRVEESLQFRPSRADDDPMVPRPPIPLDAARRGDREALAELFRAYQAPLLRYLRARRAPSSDDVASQVWVDVATSIGRFEGDDDDFRRWLFTIAHRRSVDAIRRVVRTSAPRTAFSVRAADHAAGADVEHEDHDALDRAIALVATLPDNQAEAVMLRVVNDLPIADVASVMEISEGNVRVLVHRGLTRLRRRLSVTDAEVPAMKRVP